MSWLLDLLWQVPAYMGVGLVTARQVRHRMENTLDARNAHVEPASKHHHDHGVQYSGAEWCARCDIPVAKRTMKSYYEGGAWGIPVWTGVLWVLAVPGYGVYRVGKVVGKGLSPAWSWFWENPRHRKQRTAREGK